MIRSTSFTTTTLTAALLGLSLLTPTSAAAASGETCQGQAATIVGSDRNTPIVGTEGPDVIVSTGARVVDARGGNDLICVVGNDVVPRIDAGSGDDVVDVSAGYGATAVLGPGADTYIGSDGTDHVWAGTRHRDGSTDADTEVDVIDTGRGQDVDEVHSGERGSPNGDQVRVGILAVVSWAGTPTDTSVVSSTLYSQLTVDVRGRDRVRIDNAAAVMTFEGAPPVAIPGFNSFTVQSPAGPRAFEFQGNDSREMLDLDFPRPKGHRVDMGGGTNTLRVTAGRPLAPHTVYKAGSGRDSVQVTFPKGHVVLDLGRKRLVTRSGHRTAHTRVKGFEKAAATARVARLIGTRGRNSLYVAACRGRVEGRAGGDQIGAMQPNMKLGCARRSVTALGGPGKDYLTGSPGPDLLIGGPGKDTAAGRGGRDRCEAERRSSCARRA